MNACVADCAGTIRKFVDTVKAMHERGDAILRNSVGLSLLSAFRSSSDQLQAYIGELVPLVFMVCACLLSHCRGAETTLLKTLQIVYTCAKRTGAAARKSLRRDRPVGLTSPAFHAFGLHSASSFYARCRHSSNDNTLQFQHS